jgi:manganese transport protein
MQTNMHPPASRTSDIATSSDVPENQRSLAEVYRTVHVPRDGAWARRFVAFLGPGYLVAVGYMDPGNWATALGSGVKFGYVLLSVVVVSSIMAIFVQSLCARLAIATGQDLAQACRSHYGKRVSFGLWITAEIAICATDVAEILGTAIALNLLFRLPFDVGIALTALDVLVVLWLQSKGFRWIEAFIITLMIVVALSLGYQILLAAPNWSKAFQALTEAPPLHANPEMLYLAMGIVGATIMPHNLYLHSAIVQTRAYGRQVAEKREALRFATTDVVIALSFALLVNASLLILAAAALHRQDTPLIARSIEDIHGVLAVTLMSPLAPTLFAVALLCCGLSSSFTATMAGQVVMEGFINWRVAPWARRLATRLIAIVPASAFLLYHGEGKTGALLVATQVILAVQLPFALVPLLSICRSRDIMGAMQLRGLNLVIVVAIVALVLLMNGLLIYSLAA